MKKLLLITTIAILSCSSSKPKGEPQTVIGTVAVNDQQVLIEQLEFTRSKVSFEVTGGLKDQVAGLKGKTITVKGNVIKHSPFSATIEVTEILK
ncbi:MAG: hypothetical protein U1F27_13805 [Turneriella sp.]